jgi:hypothetical protein
VPVQPALYRYAECVPTRHRLPNPQALFVQVGMPEKVPIAPPSQGGVPSSSDDRSGFDTCWDPNIDKGMKDKGDMEAYAKPSLKKYKPIAARNEDKKVFSGLL